MLRPSELTMIERYESRLHDLALAVKRDAFIVSHVVDGSGALNDFQKNNAIEKANDQTRQRGAQGLAVHVDCAPPDARRPHSRPGAGFERRYQAPQKMMMDKTHTIYVELFRELYAVRRERQALVDVQTRLAQINQDLDSAMVEALSSPFEFVRAGGK